jgi:hypothetical protein
MQSVSREPNNVAPDISKDLRGIVTELANAQFVEISDRIKLATFSISKESCLGQLRCFVWGSAIVLVFSFLDEYSVQAPKVLNEIAHFGWEISSTDASRPVIYRILKTQESSIIASQMLLLMAGLGHSPTDLKAGHCKRKDMLRHATR